MTKIGTDDIVLFACNTGELYETHKRLAREGAKRAAWIEHVSGPVLTLYTRRVEPCWAPLSTRIAAAVELCAYYERQAAEGVL